MDSRHGHGEFTWKDGKKYIGNWKTNKQDGVADLILPDGRKIMAEFKDGVRLKYIKEPKQSNGNVDPNKNFMKQGTFSLGKLNES